MIFTLKSVLHFKTNLEISLLKKVISFLTIVELLMTPCILSHVLPDSANAANKTGISSKSLVRAKAFSPLCEILVTLSLILCSVVDNWLQIEPP